MIERPRRIIISSAKTQDQTNKEKTAPVVWFATVDFIKRLDTFENQSIDLQSVEEY